MAQLADGHCLDESGSVALPTLNGEAREHIGKTLRAIYVGACDAQPITDAQVDLLLRLRHKERDRRRAG